MDHDDDDDDQDDKAKTTTTTTTHYDRLQVSSNSTLTQIKAAYHKAARQSHPDKTLNEEDHFRKIQAAWECLRHQDSRQAYDETLRVRAAQQQARRANAILLEKEDCRGPETIVMVTDDDDQEALVVAWLYTCRCGEELDIIVLLQEQESLLDCPGCSLTYDTMRVQL